MSGTFMLTRRTALLSAFAVGACSSVGPASSPLDARFHNLETLSESVHSGVSSPDGEKRLTVRLCRYPELGLAWIWVHARTPEGFFSYVDHLSPARVGAYSPNGKLYADDAGTLSFERYGALDKPVSARIAGHCLAHYSVISQFGPGQHRMELTINFKPERLYAGLTKGRTEVFGHSRAVVSIDGRQTEIEGPGQFHEQSQTTPRFTAPFCYMTLWGQGAATTLLIAPKRRDGYVLEGDASTDVQSVTVDPPAERRKLRVRLADGRSLDGEARLVHAYTVPIVGNLWRGHMMNVKLGGRDYRGHINDYIIGQGVPYAD